MNPSTGRQAQKSVKESELLTALEDSLSEFYGTRRQVVEFERRASEYRSSFSLEELNVQLSDGTKLAIMFKDLSYDLLIESGKRAKAKFIYEPEREIDVYSKILSQESLGTAICYGQVVDQARNRYWLFLEKVSGVELYQVGELEVWSQAASWLAEFHSRFTDKFAPFSKEASLLQYDKALYREWIRRAKLFLIDSDPSAEKEIKEQVEWLAEKYERVVEELIKLPQTFLHGEFYASNVLVRPLTGNKMRVCPVDWEMAGVGPCLIDLAALISGNWGKKEKAVLTSAYYNSLWQSDKWFASEEAFQEAIKYCQLYLAVQWLGWFGRRKPFRAHAHDWFGQAIGLAKTLGL